MRSFCPGFLFLPTNKKNIHYNPNSNTCLTINQAITSISHKVDHYKITVRDKRLPLKLFINQCINLVTTWSLILTIGSKLKILVISFQFWRGRGKIQQDFQTLVFHMQTCKLKFLKGHVRESNGLAGGFPQIYAVYWNPALPLSYLLLHNASQLADTRFPLLLKKLYKNIPSGKTIK